MSLIVILVMIPYHVNRLIMMKKILYIYYRWLQHSSLQYIITSLIKSVFLKDTFFSLILLILPFLWNQWLYEQLTKDIKSPISYTMFVNIGNFVYVGLIVFAIVMILTNYRPLYYIQGICWAANSLKLFLVPQLQLWKNLDTRW